MSIMILMWPSSYKTASGNQAYNIEHIVVREAPQFGGYKTASGNQAYNVINLVCEDKTVISYKTASGNQAYN